MADRTVMFVMGGPGTGKHTQCRALADLSDCIFISAGELLRAEVASGSDLGKECELLVATGQMVPAQAVVELLDRAMTRSGGKRFLVEGFPRLMSQMEAFDKFGMSVALAISLEMPQAESAARLMDHGHRQESIAQRVQRYATAETDAVLEHLRARGLLRVIDASQSLSDVFKAMGALLGVSDDAARDYLLRNGMMRPDGSDVDGAFRRFSGGGAGGHGAGGLGASGHGAGGFGAGGHGAGGKPKPKPFVFDPNAAAFYEQISNELAPGFKVSGAVSACLLPADFKAMLAESWLPKAPEDGNDSVPVPAAFDPTLPDYHLLPRCLAKCVAIAGAAKIQAHIKQLQSHLDEVKEGIAKRKEKRQDEEAALAAQLEEATAKAAELEGSVGEVKAAFGDAEPLALVPWMRTLFALADGGLTSFDVSPPAFPHCPLRAAFTSDNSSSAYEGVERILGTFLRRHKLERGPGGVQVLARLAPNIFHDGYSPELLEPLIDKIRVNLFGAEATEPLDLVQLVWWDEGADPLPTLRKLAGLCEDKIEINEEAGDFTVTEPKKIRAIGLIGFPYSAMLKVIHAGIKPASLSIDFSLADSSQRKTLQLCKRNGIKVFARGVLMGGLVAEKYLAAPAPSTTQHDADLPSPEYAVDQMEAYGGWRATQGLLAAVKSVADKHGVSMKTVAQRWVIDQGAIPVVPINWRTQDAAEQRLLPCLTAKPTFFDDADAALLDSLAREEQ